jgi:L-threonylcarbamoyladenylate synthase
MKRLTVDDIPEAIELLKNGGVFVYPTETSYGLGCDATNLAAVERIYTIKGRPETKALSVILPSFEAATKYVYLRTYSRRLAEHYWPGPFTLVAEKLPDSILSPHCTSKNRHAMRVSSHPVATALAVGAGVPIIATSANVSGAQDIFTVADILATYEGAVNQPDAYLDYGDLPVVPPTTIVSVRVEGINVLRQGGLVIREVW